MGRTGFLLLLGAATLVAACEARVGTDADAAGNAVAADDRAGDNMVSIDAPGFEMKVAIPEGVRADVESDSDLVYPGSTMNGVRIAAGEGDESAVEIRFMSDDAPATLAAWYRDPPRTGFTIDRESAEAGGTVFNGRDADGGDAFKLRLAPRGTGTQATLSIRDAG